MERIDSLVQPYITDRSILGAAVAVLKGGEAAYLGGFGESSVEGSEGKVTPHTLFALGSISKTICAALIMRLVEGGLLNLDSPVLEYLPGLKFSNPEYGKKITLRHILSHTTGLPAAGKDWGPRDPDSLRRFVYEQIPHYSFLAEPGAVHLYSSTVFCIAGHIAETVTGKYYDNLVQGYIFDPLEMVSATYDPAAALTYPVALPHETDSGGGLRVTHKVPYNVSGNPSGFAYGSVIDLANLARMFLNGGRFAGQQFLTPASIVEMHTQQASRYIDASAHPLAHLNRGYGLGFYTGEYQGRRAARHGGVSQSFNCFFDLFPDDATGVVLLTNYSREEVLMELFSALVHQALGIPDKGIVFLAKPASQVPAVDDSLLQPYCGAYLDVESGDLVNISLINGGLRIEWKGKSMPLVGYGGGQYYAEVSEKYRLPVAIPSPVTAMGPAH